MNSFTKLVFISFIVLAALLSNACATRDAYTGEEKTSRAAIGSVLGAIGGAAVGAATSSKGDRKKGILIGATSGALVGGSVGYYMDQQEAKLRKQLSDSGVSIRREGDEIILIMPGNITFDIGKARVQSSFASVLDSITLVLNEFDKTAIEITGHTDSTGSESYNQTLSEQRADAVKRELVDRRVVSGRVHSKGLGFRQPIARNDTAAGRQQNRRVEMKLVPIAK